MNKLYSKYRKNITKESIWFFKVFSGTANIKAEVSVKSK